MDVQDIEQRFVDALKQAGLHKEAQDEEATSEEETTEGLDEAPKADASPATPATLINLFQHPDAHPYVLDLAMLRKYGPEWLEWERETIELQVPLDFRTRGISDLNMHKLQAVKTMHLVDSFWQNWEVFVPVTMALNSVFPDFEVAQVPTVAQCAVAVDTARRIRGDIAWSDEMKAYLEVVHLHDGIVCSIEPLSFVEVDSEEYPVDCAEVGKKWPQVRSAGKAPRDDSTTSEQLRRLLAVQEVLKESQNRLTTQLPLLLP